MSESPVQRFNAMLDQLDADGLVALFAPDGEFVTADGRAARGTAALHQLMSDFLGQIRSMSHTVTAEWNVDDVWIAEIEADYVLSDWLKLDKVPRAFVIRDSSAGFAQVRIYGEREQALADHRTGSEGTVVGGRWIPPL